MYEKYKNSYKVTEKELVSLSVYNVGFQRCDSLYQWGPGIRDHYLIHYIISGKGFYKIGKRTYELQAGDSFLVYPNTEVVYYAAETDPWEYAWVGFTGSDASMILKATDFSPEKPIIRETPHGSDIHRQMLHIYDARGNEFEHAVEMTGRLYTMLAMFLHGASHTTEQNSANSYVQKGIEYISSNYSYAITVEDIADYVGVSRSHLYRVFMLNVGKSPIDYLTEYRINEACKLLRAGNLSIAEVAISVGFFDQFYFSRVFKRAKGVPPSKYFAAQQDADPASPAQL